VLFFTDGMVEGRSPSGDSFGVERLADMWAQHSASGQPSEEILRRLLISVVDYNGGKLRDDATLMQLCWNGPQGARLS
jgi:serine phosphatase RsbU (regulator of sigma subunit)